MLSPLPRSALLLLLSLNMLVEFTKSDALPIVGVTPDYSVPIWESLLTSYARNRSFFEKITPNVVGLPFADNSSPLQKLQEHSAILAYSPMRPREVEPNVITVPLVIAPLTFAYNIPEWSTEKAGNATLVLSLTDIAEIFSGTVKSWSDDRIRKKNPTMPLINQPINLVLRDEELLENLVVTSTLSAYSTLWRGAFGILKSMQDFQPRNRGFYHTNHQLGALGLMRSIPYSMGYFMNAVPHKSGLSVARIQLRDGRVARPTGPACRRAAAGGSETTVMDLISLRNADLSEIGPEAPYPVVAVYYASVRMNLTESPYLRNSVNPVCGLQVELYRHLLWTAYADEAEVVLKTAGLFPNRDDMTSVTLDRMACLRQPNDTKLYRANELYQEQLIKEAAGSSSNEHHEGDEDTAVEQKDLIFMIISIVIIIIVFGIFLFKYARAQRYSVSKVIINIEQMEPSSVVGEGDYQMASAADRTRNVAVSRYMRASRGGAIGSDGHKIGAKKTAPNTWFYADSILSTAPVVRAFRDRDVILRPTNITSTLKVIKNRRLEIQRYIDLDHENVQTFYGLSKSSADHARLKSNCIKNQIKSLRRRREAGNNRNYVGADFVLPWIYYVIVEQCVRGSLFELLHCGQYDLCQPMKLTVASEIASGLAYLHSKKLIHGRLSSLTCLLDSRWVVKIASWYRVEELLRAEHTYQCGSTRYRNLKISWQPEYFRLIWKSPAQLRRFIRASSGRGGSAEVSLFRCRPDNAICSLFGKDEGGSAATDAEAEEGAVENREGFEEYRTAACDVYSFGVILAEIWSMEVPFKEVLDSYDQECQLAEAICQKTVTLRISANMPPKIRKITEDCVEHSEKQRPSVRHILKTLASLVPKGRSTAHHMIRCAFFRINDIEVREVLRAEELCEGKRRLYKKLDSLFSSDYSSNMIEGYKTVSEQSQHAIIAVVGLEHGFVQKCSPSADTRVLDQLNTLKKIVEACVDGAQDLRCLATSGGFGNEGICFVGVKANTSENENSDDRSLTSKMLHVLSDIATNFAGSLHVSSSKTDSQFCAVLHRCTGINGPFGVYFPQQFMYDSALAEALEIRHSAGAMETLVTLAVTDKISEAVAGQNYFSYKERRTAVLWSSDSMDVHVLRENRGGT